MNFDLALHLDAPEALLNGDLSFWPNALPGAVANVLLQQLLNELPWQTDSIVVYGKEHTIPRLQCWLGDAGLNYTYSGKTLQPLPWHPALSALCAALNRQTGQGFNSVLCNLYRDGQDAMGWHSDDEPELGDAPVIGSISLGAERDFALRPKGATRMSGKLALPHGSLLMMEAGMQSRWQHSLPRRAGVRAARINLTFRRLLTASA